MKQLQRWRGLLFVLPGLIGVMVFYIIPFVLSFIYCFTSGVGNRKFVGFSNFKELFQNEIYRLALYNTGIIIGISLPLLCVLALLISFVIEKQIHKYRWIQTTLLIPMAIPSACLMLLWQDLFMPEGLINSLLKTHVVWLESQYAPLIIIFMIIWKNAGYNILLVINALLMMPKEYEEAANLEGANFFEVVIYIKIPYLVPMLFFSTIIGLLNCFKIFREVYLLQGNYPQNNLYLLQHFMNNHFVKLNYEILSAAAFILYILIFIIIYIAARRQQRYIEENI